MLETEKEIIVLLPAAAAGGCGAQGERGRLPQGGTARVQKEGELGALSRQFMRVPATLEILGTACLRCALRQLCYSTTHCCLLNRPAPLPSLHPRLPRTSGLSAQVWRCCCSAPVSAVTAVCCMRCCCLEDAFAPHSLVPGQQASGGQRAHSAACSDQPVMKGIAAGVRRKSRCGGGKPVTRG